MLKKDEIKENLHSLDFHNTTLRKLLKTCSGTTYADGKRAAESQAHRRSNSQDQRQRCGDAQFFDDLYEVLGKSFRCNCPTSHEANLSISDSLILFPAEDVSRAMSGLRLRSRSATLDSQVTAVGDLEDFDITR